MYLYNTEETTQFLKNNVNNAISESCSKKNKAKNHVFLNINI